MNIKPCPNCSHKLVTFVRHSTGVRIECDGCAQRGPERVNRGDAIAGRLGDERDETAP